jgi:hypothetical protein
MSATSRLVSRGHASGGKDDDQALHHQAVQGLAHRSTANAQLLREVGLDQALSRRVGLTHQRVAQLAIGACRDRLRTLGPAELGDFDGAGHTALPRHPPSRASRDVL